MELILFFYFIVSYKIKTFIYEIINCNFRRFASRFWWRYIVSSHRLEFKKFENFKFYIIYAICEAIN